MSETFTLTGYGNYVSINYSPIIKLNPALNYKLGLRGFFSYNALQNIFEGNNKIYWSINADGTDVKVITIPSGAYEIVALDDYINRRINAMAGSQLRESSKGVFSLKPNTNTSKCEIISTYFIDFTPTDSIGLMLGFSRKNLPPNILHESDLPVSIAPANSIRIDCNIVGGSHLNEAPAHTLFEFVLGEQPGEQIEVKPTGDILYLPVIVDQIDNITLKLTDEAEKLVNFGEEKITFILELKKDGSKF